MKLSKIYILILTFEDKYLNHRNLNKEYFLFQIDRSHENTIPRHSRNYNILHTADPTN